MEGTFFSTRENKYYLKDVFIEYDGPLFFLCEDQDQLLYLVSAGPITDETSKWLLARVNKQRLYDVLNNKITVHDVFLKAGRGKTSIITSSIHEEYDAERSVSPNRIGKSMLPATDFYLDLSETEIRSLQSRLFTSQPGPKPQYTTEIQLRLGFDDPNKHTIEVPAFADFLSRFSELTIANSLDKQAQRVHSTHTRAPVFCGTYKGSIIVSVQSPDLALEEDMSLKKMFTLLSTDANELSLGISDLSPAVHTKYLLFLNSVIETSAQLEVSYFPPLSTDVKKHTIERDELLERRGILSKTEEKSETKTLRGILFGLEPVQQFFSFIPDTDESEEVDPDNEDDESKRVIVGKVDDSLAQSCKTSSITLQKSVIAQIEISTTIKKGKEITKYRLINYVEDVSSTEE